MTAGERKDFNCKNFFRFTKKSTVKTYKRLLDVLWTLQQSIFYIDFSKKNRYDKEESTRSRVRDILRTNFDTFI